MSKRKDHRIILQRIRSRAFERRIRKCRGLNLNKRPILNTKGDTTNHIEIQAPSDFRLIENTQACLHFFRELRSPESIMNWGHTHVVKMTLTQVTKIDYGTISVLTAISNELKHQKITLLGNFPQDKMCRQFIIDSGFLNHMYDSHNRPFPKSEQSDLIFFETSSSEILSGEDNKKISQLVKKVVHRLTNEERHCPPIKSIILEICGNSLEWSGAQKKQWLLGVKYEEDKVLFTVTDVGQGILKTLYRKFSKKLFDGLKSDTQILMGAFDKKYDSATKEANRNKGLPSIKAAFLDGRINNLKVITNNVVLHFDDRKENKTFERGSARFKGTFYQWEMNENCINAINKNK